MSFQWINTILELPIKREQKMQLIMQVIEYLIFFNPGAIYESDFVEDDVPWTGPAEEGAENSLDKNV